VDRDLFARGPAARNRASAELACAARREDGLCIGEVSRWAKFSGTLRCRSTASSLAGATRRQCIQEGLVDEIRVFLAPVLLGDGVRFFNRPGAPDGVRLQTIDTARSGHVTDLQFRVVK